MRVALSLACAALLGLPAAAAAQSPTPTPQPQIGVLTLPPDEQTDDGVLQPGELPPEDTPAPGPNCGDDAAQGADGDYGYCTPCPDEGADGDYAYCAGSGAGRVEPQSAVEPARRFPARTLPLTGDRPLVVALAGAALLAAGLALRRRRRPLS